MGLDVVEAWAADRLGHLQTAAVLEVASANPEDLEVAVGTALEVASAANQVDLAASSTTMTKMETGDLAEALAQTKEALDQKDEEVLEVVMNQGMSCYLRVCCYHSLEL